jgi:hypothetical protein
MTEREQQEEERDELDLDSETVEDLEPEATDATDVRGGALGGSRNCVGEN